ncbi:MAG: isoprenylcysteine carboxylmethyltransferase family protein [Dehalococcoidia bacterium]|nr:isoprenylcysteine carboxylmethyltransferase family protein [Dehalococcoidia bacterium]
MKKDSFLKKYCLAKFTVGMAIEFPILIGVGIAGIIFSWPRLPFYPLPNILGVILLVIGYVIHLGYSHKELKKGGVQAHRHSTQVRTLVTSGPYSRVRHPGYSGLILIYFGFALAFAVAWMLLPAAIFTILTCLSAIKEEELLEERLGKEYQEYARQVPWRFIPRIV